MRRLFLLIALALCTGFAAGTVHGQSLSVTGPDRAVLQEGQRYPISWSADGLQTVQVVATGMRTPLGTVSRGVFLISIAPDVPARQGKVEWNVPWIDARTFAIKLKGYDAGGNLKESAQRTYEFRPAALAKRTKDGIYLDLHKRTDQRLYVQKGGRITHVYLSSSSENYLWVPKNRHPAVPHDHAGVFRVLDKSPDHYSVLFDVHMLWAMRYHGGHFIHATSPELYPYLGRAASHGCNRLTYHDAYELYKMTPAGTRVEVIGPNG